MFDLLQEEIIEIGENIGLNMNEEKENDNEKNYHIASILANKTPVLIYQEINNSYSQSLYTINLNTLEPTKNSNNQTKIPQNIKDKYLMQMNTDINMENYIPMNTKFACFDTETTGISKDDVVIQHAIGFYDENGNLLQSSCNIWKLPQNIQISESAYKVHQIGRERVNREGIDAKEELRLFQDICIELKKRNLKIIAHNASFDHRMLKQTAEKYNVDFVLQNNDFFCTMKHSKYILNLKNKIGYLKNPSNTELYLHFMNEEPIEKLHDALGDVKVTAKSYSIGLQKGLWN